MKRIQLTQGKFALIDDEDFEWLNQWKWFANKIRHTWYAGRNRHKSEVLGPSTIYMHRELCSGDMVDHRDRNGLNNRKSNLRNCSNQQNVYNSKIRSDNTSGLRGVCWDQQSGKWRASIRVTGKLVYLGSFSNKSKAAKIYNEAALKYQGSFAHLNKDYE